MYVSQMMIIWGMVPEISSTIDRMFCHFRLFFAFYTPNYPENQNFGKMKKPPGGIIILNMSTINENHMMYDSWDMKCAKQIFFVILGYFLPSYPRNSPKNENWKKLKKSTWKYHHFTQVYEKSWSYAILFLRYGAWRMKLLLFMLGYFLPLYPHNSPKNEKFKKMKKMLRDIIILHVCTKIHDHMLYCSWDMACEGCNCYFSFSAIFCPFTSKKWQKNDKFKKMKKKKKHLEISPFYTIIPKILFICYTVPKIWHVNDVIIFHFGLFFALLLP